MKRINVNVGDVVVTNRSGSILIERDECEFRTIVGVVYHVNDLSTRAYIAHEKQDCDGRREDGWTDMQTIFKGSWVISLEDNDSGYVEVVCHRSLDDESLLPQLLSIKEYVKIMGTSSWHEGEEIITNAILENGFRGGRSSEVIARGRVCLAGPDCFAITKENKETAIVPINGKDPLAWVLRVDAEKKIKTLIA